MSIDTAKQLDYAYTRREHTAAMMLQTNPPVQGDVETLKHRVESVEGEFAMDTAGIPKEGFQGA